MPIRSTCSLAASKTDSRNVISVSVILVMRPGRGDITTIRAHIDALAAAGVDDATVDAYLELARATASRAESDHRIAPKTASTIRQVLDEADWDTMAQIAAGI